MAIFTPVVSGTEEFLIAHAFTFICSIIYLLVGVIQKRRSCVRIATFLIYFGPIIPVFIAAFLDTFQK